ncbi:hypothetical protein TNCV_1135691 [Trichonephila clavipes]|nr:hypothetical protein TNCV_1135691 [Trichonephila clavipes]
MDFTGQPQCTVTSLRSWFSSNNKTSVSIPLKLKKMSQTRDIYLQWISSHVNIGGNELADRQAKESNESEAATGPSLTYQELYSNRSTTLNLIWSILLAHE